MLIFVVISPDWPIEKNLVSTDNGSRLYIITLLLPRSASSA